MVDYQRPLGTMDPSVHQATLPIRSNYAAQPYPMAAASQSYQRHSRTSSASAMNTSIQRQPTSGSSNVTNPNVPRRSTSSRSTVSTAPTSYVALMRKQKATVWCDRSQSLDPRIAAQQRAAKQRAVMEVHGGSNGTVSTSTITSGGVVGKIRHGGGPKAPGYAGTANLTGAGVPMRLSANEMLGDEEEERSSLEIQHKRTGSGRSSANSARFRSGYPRPSANTTPSDGVSPAVGISESADEHRGDEEYFETSQHRNNSIEDSFGSVGGDEGTKCNSSSR